MRRVLHVQPFPPPFPADRAAELISRDLKSQFSIERATLGRGGTWATPLIAFRELRRIARKFDLIHCFDLPALTIAATATDRPLLLTAPPDVSRGQTRWLRAVMGCRSVTVACASAIQHRRLVERGVPIERCRMIRTAVDFSRIDRRRDPVLRAALGFSDSDFVILAPGESTRAAAHEKAVWMAGMLEVLDPKFRLLVWGRGARVEATRRFAAHLHQEHILHIAERRLGRRVTFEALLPATDAIVITADEGAAALPIAVSMAAGLPIVSVTNYLTSEFLEDRHTALMVTKPSAKLLARRVLDVLDDSNLQWSISDRARAEAYDAYSASRFVDAYRSLYEA